MEIALAKVPLPCSAAQLENARLKASHDGHWHDAEVKFHGDKLAITHEDKHAFASPILCSRRIQNSSC